MESSSPLVSVIVPNYNHEKYLKQRLDSIFNQTYQNFEVIILDDFSTDQSRTILLKYASNQKVSHCVFNDQNSKNTFTQWQKGIEMAKGDFIWIAESDDYCDPDFLTKTIKPLIENKNIALSYCQSNRVNYKGEITGTWASQTDNIPLKPFAKGFELDGNLFVEKYLIFNNVIPNVSAVLIRKDVLRSFGKSLIEEDIKYCADWLLYFKVLLNHKINFLAEPLNNFRYHTGSVIGNAVKNENRISIINIDIEMRKRMIFFLKSNKPTNYLAIIKNNKVALNGMLYEKALINIRNNQRLHGIFILLRIFSFFSEKYQLRKKIFLKLKKIYS